MYFGETRRKEILVIFNILEGSKVPWFSASFDIKYFKFKGAWRFSAFFDIKYFRFKGAR